MTGRRLAGDGGDFEAAAVVIVIPVIVAFMLLATFVGRGFTATNDVTGAARLAARAASQQRNPDAAVAAAQAAIDGSIHAGTAHCLAAPTVTVDTSQWRRGGWVTVTVACTVKAADLAYFGGDRAVSYTAREGIDLYRELDP